MDIQGYLLKMMTTGSQNNYCLGSNQAAFKFVFILPVLPNKTKAYHHKTDICILLILAATRCH